MDKSWEEQSEDRFKLGIRYTHEAPCVYVFYLQCIEVTLFELQNLSPYGQDISWSKPKDTLVRAALAMMEFAAFANTLNQGETRAVDVASNQVEAPIPFGSSATLAIFFKLLRNLFAVFEEPTTTS